jgi:general secretion pathway protein K
MSAANDMEWGLVLAPSEGSGGRDRRSGRAGAIGHGRGHGHGSKREQGVALVIVMSAIAILAVFVADMHESTGTAFAVATSERDQLQAEYMAKSALNLTRLLVANEPAIRQTVTPFYQMMLGRPPPQLPVWTMAEEVLKPFCNFEEAQGAAGNVGIDLTSAEGLSDNPATCEILAFAENSKINLNDPLMRDGNQARAETALQLFALVGGYQSPSPYDPLFSQTDPDGNITSRLDVVSAMVDFWDPDTERTVFDPGAGEVSSAGAEDDVYSTLDDPYRAKNAPFDSLEEIRLVRGVGDDFWATFIEPDPNDPESRKVTIYGSGWVNANEAPPEVMLARICSRIDDQPLCTDPMESSKFIQLINTIRALIPVPLFTRNTDFIDFLEGRGDLYQKLLGFLGPENPLLFRPVTIPQEERGAVTTSFVTAAQILTVEATGFAGRSQVRIRAVVNFHDRWTPPPPNAGQMPSLGVFHHYRVD